MSKRASAVAWYTRETYEQVLKVMDDGHLLPQSFDEWLACVERVVERIERAGLSVVRVPVVPREFDRWCRLQGFSRDVEARCEFVRCAALKGWDSLWVRAQRQDPMSAWVCS